MVKGRCAESLRRPASPAVESSTRTCGAAAAGRGRQHPATARKALPIDHGTPPRSTVLVALLDPIQNIPLVL